MAEVHVCHAGTCLNRGAEGVLTEIEELASAVGGQCTVHETGCLGYCSQAPNAVVVRRGGAAENSNPHPQPGGFRGRRRGGDGPPAEPGGRSDQAEAGGAKGGTS